MDRQKTPPPRPAARRKSRPHPLIFIGVALILTPVIALGVFILRLNPTTYAPQIIAAVQRGTGRVLHINGPIQLDLSSLTPTITLNDLSLANPAGFADPNVLTLQQMRAKFALLPLLRNRLDIVSLTLVNPTFYLERNQTGQKDWVLHPLSQPSSTPSTATRQGKPLAHYHLALQAVTLQHGEIIVRGRDGAAPTMITIDNLTGQASSLTAPLHVSGSALVGTAPFTLQGVVGPLAGLIDNTPNPWPVDLRFGYAGATAHLQGEITQPRAARGYHLTFNARIADLADMGEALPPDWRAGHRLPALRDLKLSAVLADNEIGTAVLQNIVLTSGVSDLSALRPGLRLTALTLNLPTLTGTGTFSATGMMGQMPLQMHAHFTGASSLLPAFLGPASTPVPGVTGTLTASLGDTQLSLTGGVATPLHLSGAALVLGLTIPDLSTLSAVAGEALPAWKNITFKTTILDPGGQGLLHGVSLQNLMITSDNLDLGGDARLIWSGTPKLTLALNITQADLDKLRAAWPKGTASTPAPPATSTPPTTQEASPNYTLPLTLLRQASAEVALDAESLVYNHFTYTALQLHATLKNGLLSVASLTGQVPGGAISASGSLDANVEPAAATLKLNAPALALSPLLQALGLPDEAQGTVQLALDLSARGDTWPALLGTISGQAGLASVNDLVDSALVSQLFGPSLHKMGLSTTSLGISGPVMVRCMALRLDAQNGSGSVRAFTFDSNRLLLVGGGTVNFASQTLGLVLKPQLRVGHNNLTIPIALTGPFAAPHYGIASQDALNTAAQATIGMASDPLRALAGGNPLLSQIASALSGAVRGDVCGPALSLARMGQAGPAPDATLPAPDTTASSPPNAPQSLLNTLLK